ncbi:M23 family metallopeptidase [Curtobacterium sp. NPDC092190]|uniref:M23 family metallopeptidase n=1 Tax=Curtobacterium sp. NPDC092190 TaxID=3363973 RepID=UPI0037FCF1CD
MVKHEHTGGPTRRQLLTYAGAAAGAAAMGAASFGSVPAFAAVAWRYPFTREYPIGSPFGPRPSPGGIGSTNHQGLDFTAGKDTRIHAIAAGTVIFAGVSGGYGNLTKIQHADGYVSYYGHQNHIDIANGAKVSAGQFIGRVGTTGTSTGNHLHLGITRNGTFIDPAPLVVGAPFANDSSAPSTPRDPYLKVIKSPGRGMAVVGAGYFRDLPTKEFQQCAEALWGDAMPGNDRQFDLWKAISLQGTKV